MDHTAAVIIEQGRAAWPEIALPSEALARHLAAHSSGPPPPHPADFYLARACAEGIPSAISILEQRFLSKVRAFVARIDTSSHFVDEVKQRLRERLLVGPPPRISEYSGSGPLAAWLRVVALRVAIDLTRTGRAPVADDMNKLASLALDPELQTIRNEHRACVERALRDAIGRLSPRDRNVLRMHFAGSWNLEQIAQIYQVHRATVSRWTSAIREQLLASLTRELGDKLGLKSEEVQSYTRMLRSKLDAGLSQELSKELSKRL